MNFSNFTHLANSVLKLKAWKELIDVNMQVYLLIVLYILMATQSFSSEELLNVLFLMGSLGASLCYGVLVNDYCDMPTDAKVGKRVEMRQVPKSILIGLIITLLLASFLLVSIPTRNLYLLLLLGFAYFLATFYSAYPLRFKDRGALGVVVDVLIEKTLLILLIFTFFGYFFFDTILIVLLFSVMQLKVIFDHQVFDYNADLNSGVNTLAVKLGLEKSAFIVDRLLRPAFVILFIFFGVVMYFYIPYSFVVLLPVLFGYFVLRVMIPRKVIRRVNIRSDIGNWVKRIPFYDGYITASIGVLLLFFALLATIVYYPYVFLLLLALASQLYIIKGHYFRIANSLYRLILEKLRPVG